MAHDTGDEDLWGFLEDERDILPQVLQQIPPQIPVPPPLKTQPGQVQILSHGRLITFPFEPNRSQRLVIPYIIDALSYSKNLLLESPSGTGKTLALLCASLAVLQDFEENPADVHGDMRVPKIIYVSRTQAQLKQVARELASTVYRTTPTAVLASRRQLCIHPEGHRHDDVDGFCQHLRDSCSCPFYTNLQLEGRPQQFLQTLQQLSGDIEDLRWAGTACAICPYYSNKDIIMKNAKVVMTTYDYLLHPYVSAVSPIELKGNILIFDDAHNIENTCMEIASKKYRVCDLFQKVQQPIQVALKQEQDQYRRSVLQLVDIACQRLDDWTRRLREAYPPGHCVKNAYADGDLFMSHVEDPVGMFQSIGLGKASAYRLYETVKALKQHYQCEGDQQHLRDLRHALRTISGFAYYLFYVQDNLASGDPDIDNFSVDLFREGNEIILHINCLNPSVAFRRMSDARNIILASGTLAPFHSYSVELGVPFHLQIAAPHVVNENRVFAGAITDSGLIFDHTRTQDPAALNYYATEVYRIIRDLCALVPHGILVFFASYRLMSEFIARWQRQLRTDPNFFYTKQVFVEGRWDRDFEDQLRRYKKAARETYGAVYFAVARGKISQIRDFSDDEARAVVFVGIPYKSNRSLHVSRKRAFNDDMHNSYDSEFVTAEGKVIPHVNPRLTGDEWYCIEALRVMSEAMGRVIRHAKDWGVILFIEDRLSHDAFHASQFNEYLPDWVKRSGVRRGKWQWLRSQIGQYWWNIMEEINL